MGNAGGDFKGGKGKMYALEAKTGKIGDGKIFVTRLESMYRIRTDERDQAAL